MVERAGCPYCARWDKEVAPIYSKTPEARTAPLRRIGIDALAQSGIDLTQPVRYTPTFLLVDEGREVGRLTGFMNDDTFWGLLDTMIAGLPGPSSSKIPAGQP